MITKKIQEEKIQKAKKYIEKAESITIVTHVSPDGDAMGSSLGLYHFLSALGKDNVSIVVPNCFPQFYKWMPGAKEVVNSSSAKIAPFIEYSMAKVVATPVPLLLIRAPLTPASDKSHLE